MSWKKNITDHEQIEFIISIQNKMDDFYKDRFPDFRKTLSEIRSRTSGDTGDTYSETKIYVKLLDKVLDEESVPADFYRAPEFVMLALLRTDMGDKIKWYKMVENMLANTRISDNVLNAMIARETLTKRMVEKYYPEYFKPKQQPEQQKQHGCLFAGLFSTRDSAGR